MYIDPETFAAFFAGVIVAFAIYAVMSMMVLFAWRAPLGTCAKEHAGAACHYIAVPVNLEGGK